MAHSRTYDVIEAVRATLKAYLPAYLTTYDMTQISTDPDRYFWGRRKSQHAPSEFPMLHVFHQGWRQPPESLDASIGGVSATAGSGAAQARYHSIAVEFRVAAAEEEDVEQLLLDYIDLATAVIEFHWRLNWSNTNAADDPDGNYEDISGSGTTTNIPAGETRTVTVDYTAYAEGTSVSLIDVTSTTGGVEVSDEADSRDQTNFTFVLTNNNAYTTTASYTFTARVWGVGDVVNHSWVEEESDASELEIEEGTFAYSRTMHVIAKEWRTLGSP